MTELINKFDSYLNCECGLSESTRIAYGRDLNGFMAWITPSESPHSAALAELYLNSMLTRYSRSSIRRCRISIKRFFQFLSRLGIVKQDEDKLIDPIRSDPIDNLPCLSSEQINIIISNLESAGQKRNAAMIMLMVESGLRASEITNVMPNDIKLSTGTLRVHGKGASDRFVPLSQRCLNILKSLPIQPNKQLFLTQDGNKCSRQTISETVERCCARAGFPGYRSHSLRRTCASELLNNGTDVEDVKNQLGHSSVMHTERYLLVSQEHIKDQVKQFHPSFQENKK